MALLTAAFASPLYIGFPFCRSFDLFVRAEGRIPHGRCLFLQQGDNRGLYRASL